MYSRSKPVKRVPHHARRPIWASAWLTLAIALPLEALAVPLPTDGSTLRVEAEDASTVWDPETRPNPCTGCSGQSALAYYWANNWFEVEVEVPEAHLYTLAIAAASPDGTSIAVEQWDNGTGLPFATLDLPSSQGDWNAYSQVEATGLTLPPGDHVLRFINTANGANIDFLEFTSLGQAEPPGLTSLPTEAGSTVRLEGEAPWEVSTPTVAGSFCDACSGDGTLIDYGPGSWFEMRFEVPETRTYRLSMVVSAATGTIVNVVRRDQGMDEPLATMDVAPTWNPAYYTRPEPVDVTLPAGPQTLRFYNFGDDARVDYVELTAVDVPDDIREFDLPAPGQSTVGIQAERFSGVSATGTAPEICADCLGRSTLANYWPGSWFELTVDVPEDGAYAMSLRASSPAGTVIEAQRVVLGATTPLATVQVPSTGDWQAYVTTEPTVVDLTAGRHVLRFANTVDGANVDAVEFTALDDSGISTYRPAPNTGPDRNPLKGWNTAHDWHRDNASVGFQYLRWGEFQPDIEGDFVPEYVEAQLGRPATQGRHFIVQFIVDEPYQDNNPDYVGPDGLLDIVGSNEGVDDPSLPPEQQTVIRATRYNDPYFIAKATEAIEALTALLRDDPRNFVVQVGVLGFWGEWHTFPRVEWGPTDDTKRDIMEAYLDNLGLGNLTQVRFPDDPVVRTLEGPGIGYTNGSVVPTDHGREFGHDIDLFGVWQNGPVGGEWPPNIPGSAANPDDLWDRFFLTDEGMAMLEQGRYSTVFPPLNEHIRVNSTGWTPEGRFMEMHRRLGYNFQLGSVRYAAGADSTRFELELHNVGIAPFYKDWTTQVAVLDARSDVVALVDLPIDLREIAPDTSLTLTGRVDGTLDPAGTYQLGLRFVQPGADASKDEPWPLDAANVFITLANDVAVVPARWDDDHALRGGWNILGGLALDPCGATPCADTDGDGLLDVDEFLTGTDPTMSDTDGDGLSDPEEAVLGTDPLAMDTDADGLSDAEEVQEYGTDPTVAEPFGVLAPMDWIAGSAGTLRVVGALPSSSVYVLASSREGLFDVPTCVGTTVELRRPTLLGRVSTDGVGSGALEVTPPAAFAGRSAWLAAVALSACEASSTTSVSFLP